jgi:hypothetical protein
MQRRRSRAHRGSVQRRKEISVLRQELGGATRNFSAASCAPVRKGYATGWIPMNPWIGKDAGAAQGISDRVGTMAQWHK